VRARGPPSGKIEGGGSSGQGLQAMSNPFSGGKLVRLCVPSGQEIIRRSVQEMEM